jgi:hypothetical protein
MIAIGSVLVSDEIVQEQFVCDLERCKGGCCVDGDCGAPLTAEEAGLLKDIYPKVKAYLPEAHVAEIERQGTSVWDNQYGDVTPAINGGICVYGYTDEAGIVKCGIEKAWQEGVVDWQKPISCHLFPIRVIEQPGYEAVNYEPRETLCKPACKLGRKLKVPVYKFLKGPITRKWGAEFYEALDAVAEKMRIFKG